MSSSDTDDSHTVSAFDERHPLYNGTWQRSIPYRDLGISQDRMDEPHLKRKHVILRRHPEVVQLYGYDPRTKWVAFAAVAVQVALAYLFGRVWTHTYFWYVLVAYVIGGSLTGLYGVIFHECTHNLTAKTSLANRWIGLITNIGLPLPIYMAFRRFHLEHHTYQGVFGVDPDLPLDWEVNFIRGNTVMKLIWMFFFPVMYIYRGALQGKTPSYWECVNYVFTLFTDAVIVYVCGWRGFGYLGLSTWLGYGLHPAAVHFIQEHYTWKDGQETYSYYGSGNKLFLNIGYHNEHHDFVAIPWSKLPELKKIAKEFYEPLDYHSSWFSVLWEFLTSPQFGPQSRVGRELDHHRKARKMLSKVRAG